MTQYTNRLKANPLRLLLYLEWILFFITMMGQFNNLIIPVPPVKLPLLLPNINPTVSPLSVLCMVFFITLSLWQPNNKYWSERIRCKLIELPLISSNISYIGLGFILIGLTSITSNKNLSIFPGLHLIIVIRGCLSFKLPGSIIVAGISFSWFLISLFLAIQNSFTRLDIQQIPAIITPGIKPEIIYQLYSNEEQLKALTINMAIHITVFFCLISLFVFLLVNALLSEYRSRQELGVVNQQLREYALLIEDRAMLQERNRIAREIHDSLGHSLTAQNIQLANALLYLRSNLDNAENFLSEAKKLGSHALKEVRHSVATLRSDPLQGKLLNVAIAELITDLQYRTEIICHSKIEIPHRLPREITTTVYRIVQEALTNMMKHSQATEVKISLQLIANNLEVQIKDNGKGFNPKENTTGFGIQGMRERTKALGGNFNLISLPEMGCQIIATIPLLARE